jgi:hypothetical protein
MLKIVSKYFAATILVAVPFVFCGCDKITNKETKEVVTTTDRDDGQVIKKEETTTTTTTDN